jgi:hypothetical protein
VSSNPITGLDTPREYDADAHPLGELAAPWAGLSFPIRQDADYPIRFRNLVKGQDLIHLEGYRLEADLMTTTDGNPDTLMYLRSRNQSVGDETNPRIRTLFVACRNDSGCSVVELHGLRVEVDNRGAVGSLSRGLYIGMRSNGVNAAGTCGGIQGIQIEFLGQAVQGAAALYGIWLKHNDESNNSIPVGIYISAQDGDNGWAYALQTAQYGIDKAGAASAASAVMKLYDDGENADIATGVATVNGAIKVVIGTTVCYIPTYAGYTAA